MLFLINSISKISVEPPGMPGCSDYPRSALCNRYLWAGLLHLPPWLSPPTIPCWPVCIELYFSSFATRQSSNAFCFTLAAHSDLVLPCYSAAITSISINAPFGSVLTATAERAGYGSAKNSA